MKLSAMLSRQKGRDFYDVLFLLAQTEPDYKFLGAKSGIHSIDELKAAVADILNRVDLKHKMKDFEHLLFNKPNAARILHIGELFTTKNKVEF